MSTKRIYLCGIKQESNSFNTTISTLNNFEIEQKDNLKNSEKTRVKGVLKTMEEENFTPIFGSCFWASPGAPVSSEVVDCFLKNIEDDLLNIEQLDGVAIIFHGATVCETIEDVCGHISERIRNNVGENIPITASFDLHANITKKVAKNIDFICGFHEYPHLDTYETSCRSIKVLSEYFKGNKIKTYLSFIPMIASASGYTTQTKELKELMQKGFDYVKQGKIIDFSIFQVQPWLDVNEMASVVTVIGSDERTAKEITKELAIGEFELRDKIQGESFYTIEEVIQKARENKSGKPIIICDSADSPNAGASGDSAFVVEKLLCVKDEFNIAVAVNDVKAVDKAFELGESGVGDFTIGATVCPKLSKPVTVHGATVEKLGDGNFAMFGPESKGERFSIGKCAVIKTGKMNILISYYGKCEGDRNFYNFMGVNPELMDIVDVKACTSFRAGYNSICAGIYNVQTMGAANPVISLLPYEKRPKPLYPFEEITIDLVDEPKSYR